MGVHVILGELHKHQLHKHTLEILKSKTSGWNIWSSVTWVNVIETCWWKLVCYVIIWILLTDCCHTVQSHLYKVRICLSSSIHMGMISFPSCLSCICLICFLPEFSPVFRRHDLERCCTLQQCRRRQPWCPYLRRSYFWRVQGTCLSWYVTPYTLFTFTIVPGPHMSVQYL